HLEQVRRDLPRLVAHLARRHRGRRAGDRRRAARVGPQAIGRGVGVAFFDLDVGGGDAKLLGEDLRARGLVTLALRLRAEGCDRLVGRVHADLARVEHLEAENVEVLGRTRADDLREARDADAHELPALALLGLLATQLRVADRVHRLLQRALVIAAVV